jgi:multidrug efflux pump subunit AcrA (membrane-fusion protein)
MALKCFALAAGLLLGVSPVVQAAGPANPLLKHCLISIKDEVQVPAQEPGVLISLEVHEGQQVSQGQLVGQIDDTQRQMEKRLAAIEQKAAQEQAENDIKVRFSDAAAQVAQAEYEAAIEANNKVRGTFPLTEVRRLKLNWQKSFLEIEQSQVEQRIAQFTYDTRGGELEAAEMNIARRKIISPLEGEVVAVLKHKGEWLQPGEPVLRIVRFDTLRIEGFLNASAYDPSEVANRPVSVVVELARGRQVQFTGNITYVSPLVQAGGEYRVWAEVANRQENGQWLLRPGLNAEMTVMLK